MKPYVYIAAAIPEKVEACLAGHCKYRKWEGKEPPDLIPVLRR